jgi:hypothetical protein
VVVNATRADEVVVMATMGTVEAAVLGTDTPDPTLVLIGWAMARARV